MTDKQAKRKGVYARLIWRLTAQQLYARSMLLPVTAAVCFLVITEAADWWLFIGIVVGSSLTGSLLAGMTVRSHLDSLYGVYVDNHQDLAQHVFIENCEDLAIAMRQKAVPFERIRKSDWGSPKSFYAWAQTEIVRLELGQEEPFEPPSFEEMFGNVDLAAEPERPKSLGSPAPSVRRRARRLEHLKTEKDLLAEMEQLEDGQAVDGLYHKHARDI